MIPARIEAIEGEAIDLGQVPREVRAWQSTDRIADPELLESDESVVVALPMP